MDRISALMDGEVRQTETRHAILHLKQSEECCDTWNTFHLIGDIMRGDPLLRDDFMTRFHARMEHEPTQLAPRVTWQKSVSYALSAAASLAAVAVVLTLVLADNPLKPQVQIAAEPKTAAPQAPAQTRPVAVANQGPLNEYLLAHQEFSPSTALQGVVPYARTVAETHYGSGR